MFSVYGPGSCAEWAAEGRRLVPLMPRLVPQTVFSASATAAANTASAANAKALASSGVFLEHADYSQPLFFHVMVMLFQLPYL